VGDLAGRDQIDAGGGDGVEADPARGFGHRTAVEDLHLLQDIRR
jgi:hypothetical protein